MLWQLEPLGAWPYEPTSPRQSSNRFKAGWQATLNLLEAELDWLEVTGAVAIRVDADASQIRRDGMLRAHARVGFPGVIISFTCKHGPMSYATDAYEQQRSGASLSGWQANVRAIALGLEALRAVDRYGITRSGEQYTGWKQLPAGTGEPATGMTRDQAIAILEDASGIDWRESDQQRIHRAARGAAHPDRHGGNRAWWDRIEAAATVLGLVST